jgi:hypothetical protein
VPACVKFSWYTMLKVNDEQAYVHELCHMLIQDVMIGITGFPPYRIIDRILSLFITHVNSITKNIY